MAGLFVFWVLVVASQPIAVFPSLKECLDAPVPVASSCEYGQANVSYHDREAIGPLWLLVHKE